MDNIDAIQACEMGQLPRSYDSTFEKEVPYFSGGNYLSVPVKPFPSQNGLTFGIFLKTSVVGLETPRSIVVAENEQGTPVWELELNEMGEPVFSTKNGSISCPCLSFDDQQWHHITIRYDGSELMFFRDLGLAKACPLENFQPETVTRLIIGAKSDGRHPFNGNMEEVCLVPDAVSPQEITTKKLSPTVPENNPVWKWKRGIVFDRIQVKRGNCDLEELPYRSSHRISDRDIEACVALGFDHVKLLFTSDFFMDDHGAITEDGRHYIAENVDRVLRFGLPCMICMHPEQPYKQKYLGNWDSFEVMLRFYEEMGRLIADHSEWTPERVAFQLMSEPFANIGEWNLMTARMWNATRRGTPDHTLLLSSDEAGNIHRMMRMLPVPDTNVIYCFTTYEPYEFGFSALVGMTVPELAWRKWIGPLPYPASPEAVQERMETLLAHVPEEDRGKAEQFILSYGQGRFNRDWHFHRACLIDDWASSFGGKLRVMCVEFGCFDPMNGRMDQEPVIGITDQERWRFVEDLRASFEFREIGWSYWSFNETFTIFEANVRQRFKSIESDDQYRKWLDTNLLQALGLSWQNSLERRRSQLVHGWNFMQMRDHVSVNEEDISFSDQAHQGENIARNMGTTWMKYPEEDQACVVIQEDKSGLLVKDFYMKMDEDFTIVMKVRVGPPADHYRILLALSGKESLSDDNRSTSDSETVTYFQLKLDPKSNEPVFYAPLIALNLESTIPLQADQWNTLVLSYSQGIFRMFVDGKLAASAQRNEKIHVYNHADLVIGAWTEAFHHAAKNCGFRFVEIYEGDTTFQHGYDF